MVANIDGEYVNRPNALSVALFDLDRVEVLRGNRELLPDGRWWPRRARPEVEEIPIEEEEVW